MTTYQQILGVDASNVREAGLLNYLVEIINGFVDNQQHFRKVVIWSCQATLNSIHDSHRVLKVGDPLLEKSLTHRLYWQRYRLAHLARAQECDVLLVPGGHYFGRFRPFVAVHSNAAPFMPREIFRFFPLANFFRLLSLRYMQSETFRRADGVIFLSEFSKEIVERTVRASLPNTALIPMACDSQFDRLSGTDPSEPSITEVNRILYVSKIMPYKHQWHVVEAVANLSRAGFPVQLDIVGTSDARGLRRFRRAVARFDPNGQFVRYHGFISRQDLHRLYQETDVFVFASSCEAQPVILNEAMASGLPIACSNRRPMPDVLQDAGLYFDPEAPDELCEVLKEYLGSAALRHRNGLKAHELSRKYTWSSCAADTFSFVSGIATAQRQGLSPLQSLPSGSGRVAERKRV